MKLNNWLDNRLLEKKMQEYKVNICKQDVRIYKTEVRI